MKALTSVNKLLTNYVQIERLKITLLCRKLCAIYVKYDTRVTVTVIMSCLQPTPNMI